MATEKTSVADIKYAESRKVLDHLATDPRDALAGLMLNPELDFVGWFTSYVQKTLDVDVALVGEIRGSACDRIQTMDICRRGQKLENISYPLAETPNAALIEDDSYMHRAAAHQAFPSLSQLVDKGLESYFHITIKDLDGMALGVAAILDHKPINERDEKAITAQLLVFRGRLATELIRRRAINSLQVAAASALTSQASLRHLLQSTCQATRVRTAFIAERKLIPPHAGCLFETMQLTTLAMYHDDELVENTTIEVSGTLLAETYPPGGLLVADRLVERCPATAALAGFDACSFLGYQGMSPQGDVLGQLVLLHDKPMPRNLHAGPLLHELLTRIGGELQRLSYEKQNQILIRRVMDAERRNSIGSLASGIAHDFNNILFAVSGQAHLVDHMYQDDASLREQMSVISAACEQASGLCHQLMTYAGHEPSHREEIDLNAVVLGCNRIANIFAKGKTRIEYSTAEQPILLHGSKTRLQQVVMNLLKNSVDSIAPGGTIRVTTRQEECDPQFFETALLGERQKGGPYAVLEVQDTGSGIPEQLLRQIFEPFFSTKDSGSGMGLAVVMGGATEHDAAIFIETALDEGTCFRIYFPMVHGDSDATIGGDLALTRPVAPGQNILIIDDDDLVRQTMALILRNADFQVTTASSGQDGLTTIKQMGGSLAAVVLDYRMPHMLGDEVLQHLRAIAPSLPVILISGNVSHEQVAGFSHPPDVVLRKPVLPQRLVQTLHSLIRARDEIVASGS